MMEQAIKKAIEGGFEKGKDCIDIRTGNIRLTANPELYLLDPLFWQALGKAEGWGHVKIRPNGQETKEHYWLTQWKRFIDHLADGKDIESFFNNLLTTSSEQEER